jgi:tellurite resistance protein
MKTLGGWIKSAVQQVVDPDREERIQEIATLLHQGLCNAREKFSIKAFSDLVGCTEKDLEKAKRIVYKTILDKAWQDNNVTAAELQTLKWVTERLEIPASEVRSTQERIARERFSTVLAQAMDDGVLEEGEAKRLEKIAESAGFTLEKFVKSFFLQQGEDFLRGLFTACTEGGALLDDAWNRLATTAQRLGLSKKELVVAILPQAERFIEHVLADAKSDGELSEKEESHLIRLTRTLELPARSCGYIKRSIYEMRTIRLARKGKLPICNSPAGIAIRSGEIVHFHAPATWLQKRILKSGEQWDNHVGTLTITDNRLLFSSDTRSFDVRFSRIVSHYGQAGAIQLQRMEKPESVVRIDEEEPIAYAILEGALALANQTRLAKEGGVPDRHIPREVRQRVWQRYGGRCAECGASQYLEFDHVIPVAKGGNNSDANVQLLCRACNLKKSDLI